MTGRQHPRYAIELDAQIDLGERVVAGRTRDISIGGFSMLADEPVPVHSDCEIKLALVFSQNEFSEQLVLPASIVWCTALKQAHQIGVKFGELTPQTRDYLDLFVRFLEGGEEDGEEDPSPIGRKA
jgi:hypothetical protein